MATVVIPLKIRDADATPGAVFPTTQLTYSSGGGVIISQIPLQLAIFPDSILSGAVWTVTPNVIGTPALTVVVDWFAPAKVSDGSANTGNVFWSFQVAALAANASPLTKAFAAVTTTTTAASATANGRARTSFALGVVDSFSNTNQPLFVKVTRDGTQTTDTLVGDVAVFGINVNYSDT